MNNTVKTWLGKLREKLNEIYHNAEPGNIPSGDTRGTAIQAGSIFSEIVATFARLLAWQGTVFDLFCPGGYAGILVNKVTLFGCLLLSPK